MLFTFPSRYWFAIGLSGVFSLAGWSRRIRAELLVLRVTQDDTRLHSASLTGLSPSMVELSRTFCSLFGCHNVVLLPRICIATHAVWALPRSLATTGGIISLFSLPPGTKMFQFPGFASAHEMQIITLQVIGLSHSEIPGSEVICTYPGLIAAYHVLHRLREPRHPPDALTFFRLRRPHPKRKGRAHTISCSSRFVNESAQFQKNKVFTYSFLCVNMSKISKMWRITDSNR